MKKTTTYKILFAVFAVTLSFGFIGAIYAFIGPTATPPSGSGSLYLDSNANLGIGTTNPTPTNFTTGRFFAVGTTSNPGILLRDNDGYRYVIYVSSTTGYLTIWDDINSINRFYIATSGDVYVGGNMYANAFVGSLSGALSAANVSSGVFGSLQGNGAFAFPASLGVATSSQTGLPANLSVYGSVFSSGNVMIGTATTTYKLDVQGGQVNSSGGFCIAGDCRTAWSEFWLSTSTYLYPSSTSWNVGVGTTTPTYKLTVSGETYSTGSSTATAYCLSGTCMTSWNNIGQWTTASGGIYYTGNVSIGTSTLGTYPLYISTSTDSLLALRRSGSTYPTIFKQGTDGVLIVNNANVDVLTLKDGLVGIGSTSPGQRLTVASSSGISIDATSGRIVNLGAPSLATDAATKAYVDSAAANATNYWGLSSTNLYPTSTAYNVGIGTTTPSYKLEVAGDASVNGTFRISGVPTLELSSGQLNIASSSSITSLMFHTSGSTRLLIDSSGRVGVASSSPGYGLTVTGTGYFSQPVFVGTPTNAGHAATRDYVDTLFIDGSFTTLTVTGTSTLSGNWQLGGASLGNINMNGNDITAVNKLTVSTIDPVYEIAGKKYATYVSDTVGLKMEAYGKVKLTKGDSGYYALLDFKNAEVGSDLWLFWQTADLGKNMEHIILTISSEGDSARIWYSLSPENNRIVIRGDKSVSVSYHLVAPRHDASEWPSILMNSKEKGVSLPLK